MTLREAREGDLEFLQRITQTPGWLANIGPRGTEMREGALAYLERSFLTPYREYGYGLWVVEVEGLAVGLSGIVRRPAAPNPDSASRQRRSAYRIHDTHAVNPA